ncbi:cell wall anchor [Diplodia corticola]|uniref:Cell wall anchor n=1 Tax=Diplodia corticola TaxID=236234 RepID=A0A1J9RTB5_9PEZI|nr:cell wall anchor [Diplodia corticola]OJD31663.1 cell wall anchor [Diplodia corticola]
MKAFRISRAPAAAGDAAFDPFAKLVFEPALESDELFDALRESYPTLKTHTERKKQAVLDFLMEERRAIEQEITAFVQQTGTPAPQPDDGYSARPSPVFSTSTSLDLRKLSTSNSSTSSLTRSAGSSPETLSLKDMTSVWTAAGHGKPKIHTRRSMTTREKEEYRRRRQMKACKECRSRKRKCNHDPSNASSAASPSTGSKVKKRTSTTTSSNPLPSQQAFLSSEFDSSSFLADSTFSTSDSPLDFLDFSPATGTEGSFEDFLLLPQDDFSSIDFATDPLFQPVPQSFSYDPFIEPQQSQQHYTPSTGSRSPASTYQSSGMSRSASNSNALDTSQSWSFDLDPMVDVAGGHVLSATFSSASTDGKQSGLAAGLSRNSLSSSSSRNSPTQSSAVRQSSHSLDGGVSPEMSSSSRTRPSLGGVTPSSFLLPGLRQVPPGGGMRHERLPLTTHGMTTTNAISTHTVDLPRDAGLMPAPTRDSPNVAQYDDARRDGLVLGTDPSAGSRFGEHGSSLARRPLYASGRVDTLQDRTLPHSDGDGLLAVRPLRESGSNDTEALLSSRNPTSVNRPRFTHSDALSDRFSGEVVSDSSQRTSPSFQSRSTTSLAESHTVAHGEGQDGTPRPASAAADARVHAISDSSADQALAVSRSCKDEEPKRSNVAARVHSHALDDGASGELLSLAAVHTRPFSQRDVDGARTNVEQRSSLLLKSSISAMVFVIASLFSALVRMVISSLLHLASASREQDALNGGRLRTSNISSGYPPSSSLMEVTSSTPIGIGKVRLGKPKILTTSATTPVFSALLCGVHRSCLFV